MPSPVLVGFTGSAPAAIGVVNLAFISGLALKSPAARTMPPRACQCARWPAASTVWDGNSASLTKEDPLGMDTGDNVDALPAAQPAEMPGEGVGIRQHVVHARSPVRRFRHGADELKPCCQQPAKHVRRAFGQHPREFRLSRGASSPAKSSTLPEWCCGLSSHPGSKLMRGAGGADTADGIGGRPAKRWVLLQQRHATTEAGRDAGRRKASPAAADHDDVVNGAAGIRPDHLLRLCCQAPDVRRHCNSIFAFFTTPPNAQSPIEELAELIRCASHWLGSRYMLGRTSGLASACATACCNRVRIARSASWCHHAVPVGDVITGYGFAHCWHRGQQVTSFWTQDGQCAQAVGADVLQALHQTVEVSRNLSC